MSAGKSWRDKTWKELLGTEVTFKATVSGVIDNGREVQLLMPDGLFVYIPSESVLGALDEQ